MHKQTVNETFQQTLFGDDAATRVTVSEVDAFTFHLRAYAPNHDYDGRFSHFDCRKHYYGCIGDFDSKEQHWDWIKEQLR